MFEYSELKRTLDELGGRDDRNTFELLCAVYGEPTRFYHDSTHVAECLAEFQKYRDLAVRPAEVEAAIWFHDAIYDTRASDNEEKSAELAERQLGATGVGSNSISRISEMIRATKTHEVSTVDSQLMIDVDLGILGASEKTFERYDRNIRKEYDWVPIAAYRTGRIRVLQTFLEREIIYHTVQIRELYEVRARENLARKIAQLDA